MPIFLLSESAGVLFAFFPVSILKTNWRGVFLFHKHKVVTVGLYQKLEIQRESKKTCLV